MNKIYKNNVKAIKKYYDNATKEQVIEDMFLDICDLQMKIDNAIERLNALIVFWKKYNPIDNTMQVEQFKGVIDILGGDVDDE